MNHVSIDFATFPKVNVTGLQSHTQHGCVTCAFFSTQWLASALVVGVSIQILIKPIRTLGVRIDKGQCHEINTLNLWPNYEKDATYSPKNTVVFIPTVIIVAINIS